MIWIHIYEQYRDYGMGHTQARANTLDDAAAYGVSASQRIRLSYYINKLKGV